MSLPHFTNIQSHNKLWEPVYKNLFEVQIVLPKLVGDRHQNASEMLLENATSIRLPVYPTLGNVPQRYKYSTRMFTGFPDSTSITDLSVKFNMNQNDSNQMFTFRVIKDWYDLLWNNEDGSSHYKKNAVGEIILYQHDREGVIIRRVSYHNCQLTQFADGGDLVWNGGQDIMDVTATWVVDYWEDYYF